MVDVICPLVDFTLAGVASLGLGVGAERDRWRNLGLGSSRHKGAAGYAASLTGGFAGS